MAFARFTSTSTAVAALLSCHNMLLQGRHLRVSFSHKNPEAINDDMKFDENDDMSPPSTDEPEASPRGAALLSAITLTTSAPAVAVGSPVDAAPSTTSWPTVAAAAALGKGAPTIAGPPNSGRGGAPKISVTPPMGRSGAPTVPRRGLQVGPLAATNGAHINPNHPANLGGATSVGVSPQMMHGIRSLHITTSPYAPPSTLAVRMSGPPGVSPTATTAGNGSGANRPRPSSGAAAASPVASTTTPPAAATTVSSPSASATTGRR
jgi:hypothetical protein